MRTLVRVHDANCTYCMNAVRDELLARPLVHDVRMSATAGCLEVDHDHDDPSVLIGVLRRSLQGWEVADNGEIVMVRTDPELTHECTLHAPDQPRADHPHDVERPDPLSHTEKSTDG